MKSQKFFNFLLTPHWLLILSLSLTACGGGGGNKSTTKNSVAISSSSAHSVSSINSSTTASAIQSSSIAISSVATSAVTSSAITNSSTATSSLIAASSSSSSSSVVIVLDNIPPTVSLVASTTNITAATAVNLTASASDNVGVTKVEFYDGASLIGTDLTAPYAYSINLNATNNGTKTFKAVAFDAAGNATTSGVVTVTIDIDTAPPSSVILGSSSSNITAAGSFTLTTTATDNKAVTKVEFYDGATLLATDTSAPFTYSVSVTSANNGTKSYTAKAFDAAANSAVSNAVSVTINIDIIAPTVTLASSSTNVTTVGNITLTANAADNTGVTKVEFYDGTTLLNTDTSSPYSYAVNFSTSFTGNKTYTAKAYDAATNVTTSNAVNVNINVNVDTAAPVVSYLSPANHAAEVTLATEITVSFSEAMQENSVVGTLIVSDYPSEANSVTPGFTVTFSNSSKNATFIVNGGLQRGKIYKFDVNAKDLAGNLMAATYAFDFTTEPVFAGVYTGKNVSGSTTVKAAVEYYPSTATGNPTATRTLEGSNTTINNWKSLVIDSKGNEYISTPTGIAIFKAWDSGNSVPRSQISGNNTGLNTPTALALNAAETELFVLDQSTASISVFSTTTLGNVFPIRKISGEASSVGSVKDMVLHQNEIFVLGGASNAPKIWVFNQNDDGNPTAKRVMDVTVPSSQPAINFLNAYDGKLVAYGSVTMNFAGTLETSTSAASFVLVRYHSDMGRTNPGSISPPMLRVAGSQLWINYYGVIYKLDDNLSTLETGPVTPQFTTTGNNIPFIFVAP